MRTGLRTLLLGIFWAAGLLSSFTQAAEDLVEEMVVTGTHLRLTPQSASATPVKTFTRDDYAVQGWTRVEDALLQSTANSGSQLAPTSAGASGRDGMGANLDLRGLGFSTSLLLVNGQRVVPSEREFSQFAPDLRTVMPLIALERVEILLDGASPIYGSDAVAGVANFLTRERFEGFELQAQLDQVDGSDRETLQVLVGGATGRLGGYVAIGYEKTSLLLNGERDITDFDRFSTRGQPGSYILFGRPQAPNGGDLIIDNSVTTTNYTALFDQQIAAGAPFVGVADPVCNVPGSGGSPLPVFPLGFCQLNFQREIMLRPAGEMYTSYGRAFFEFSEDHMLIVEVSAADVKSELSLIASQPIFNALPFVPASHPNNPFGVDVGFAGRVKSGRRAQTGEKQVLRTALAFEGVLGGEADPWQYRFSIQHSEAEHRDNSIDTNIGELQEALFGLGGRDCASDPASCVYFNPFGTGGNVAAAFDDLSQDTTVWEDHFLDVVEIVVNKSLRLGHMQSEIAFGAQRRELELRHDTTDFRRDPANLGVVAALLPLQDAVSDETDSVFVELSLPFTERFSAVTALRHEETDDFSTTDPKFTLHWQAISNLALRGSWGTSFRTPPLFQRSPAFTIATQTELSDPNDPLSPGRIVRVPTSFTTNQDLDPEESTHFNVGMSVDLEPVTIDLDYWDFKNDGQIATEIIQRTLDNDPGNPRFERDESGFLTGVQTVFINAGQVDAEGVDLSVNLNTSLLGGAFGARWETTWVRTYDFQFEEGGPTEDRVGFTNQSTGGFALGGAARPMPEWRSNLYLTWFRNRHSASARVHYIHSVKHDVGNGVSNNLSSHTATDVQYRLSFGNDAQYSVAVGANNVFDRDPPRALDTGYVADLHDALGRRLYLSFEVAL